MSWRRSARPRSIPGRRSAWRGRSSVAMPVTYLTRIVGFRATHRVAPADWTPEQNRATLARAPGGGRRPARPGADWTPEQNRATFARAAEDHAHDYQCRVTVKGALDA